VFAHDWLEVGWAVRDYLGFRLDIALGLEKKETKRHGHAGASCSLGSAIGHHGRQETGARVSSNELVIPATKN